MTVPRRALPALRVAGGARCCDVTSIPRTSDLAHECGVDDEVAERLDEHQVELAKPAAGLNIDAHLRSITVSALLGDPCKVQNTVHGGVRDLGSPLVVRAIQRRKATSSPLHRVADHTALRTASKMVGKANAQRGFSASGDWTFRGGIVPTEPGSQAKSQPKECAAGCTLRIGEIEGGQDLKRGVSIVGTSSYRQRPGIEQCEIGRDLGDHPRMRLVGGVRKPHGPVFRAMRVALTVWRSRPGIARRCPAESGGQTSAAIGRS